MADLSHGPAPQEPEDPGIALRNARYGLRLFALYLAIYSVFVLLNAFWPDVMSRLVAGVSVAVIYGMVLIVAAFVLALVYTWQCRQRAAEPGVRP